MCGIAGVIGDFHSNQLDAMLLSQHHRGPDATAKYEDANLAALGHNRLAIIDLSAQSNQPFFDNSGRYIIVFNGEIYNYLELKAELHNSYSFKTQSDTEVLLAAFISYGTKCLDKLNGMFSFAIWDKQEQKLFAARDRFGVKPFYYSQDSSNFYFASEIKALHAAGIKEIPNEKVWSSYFSYGSYGNPDETFWEGIQQLPGGHFLEVKNQKLEIKKWYFFEDAVANQPKKLSYEQAKAHYLSLLKDSIKLRFRADVAVGFNISGGLDSSVLLAMVNNQQPNFSNNAYTFYTADSNYDELPWVKLMLSHSQNPLKEVLFQAAEAPEYAEEIYRQQDEPYGGVPTLAYAKIFEQARKDKVLVLLDGQGMDEQWAGYDYYTQVDDAIIQGVAAPPFKSNMLTAAFLAKAEKPNYPQPFADAVLNKQYRDLFYTKIPRALRFNDRISMRYGTELREPFLDYRLVEFAFSLPLEFKIKEGVTKYMLREIAAEYLSSDLVFAPKRPVQTPQREWLAADLKDWVQLCFDKIEAENYGNWMNVEQVKKELHSYFDGQSQSSFHIWQCISLANMLENFDK